MNKLKNTKKIIMQLNSLKVLEEIIACPFDKSNLEYHEEFFECIFCHKKFLIQNNLIDFSIKEKINLDDKGSNSIWYQEYYDTLIGKSSTKEKFLSFGTVSNDISVGFVNETTKHLLKYSDPSKIVCDIGAGTGDYSLSMAKMSKFLFHCDLDINGIKIAQKKAKLQNIDNVYFLRCDYFKLPFKDHALDLTYAIDVVERGKDHDSKLIHQLSRITHIDGLVIFDCHLTERLKFTRVKEDVLYTYSKFFLLEYSQKFNLKILKIIGTGYVPQLRKWGKFEYKIYNFLCKLICIPPARWLVINKISN